MRLKLLIFILGVAALTGCSEKIDHGRPIHFSFKESVTTITVTPETRYVSVAGVLNEASPIPVFLGVDRLESSARDNEHFFMPKDFNLKMNFTSGYSTERVQVEIDPEKITSELKIVFFVTHRVTKNSLDRTTLILLPAQ